MFNPVPTIQARYAIDAPSARSVFRARVRAPRTLIICTLCAAVLAGASSAVASALGLGRVGRGAGIFVALMIAMALSHRLTLATLADAARHERCLRCDYPLRELGPSTGHIRCPECGLSNPAAPVQSATDGS